MSKTIRDYLARQTAPYCGLCHERVDGCGKEAIGCICFRCTEGLSSRRGVDEPAEPTCPDCGKAVAGKGRCPKCSAKRLRAAGVKERARKVRA